jgi:hypothetical protein
MYIPKQRLLINIVARCAEPTFLQVVRLSAVFLQERDLELLAIDKSSQNETLRLIEQSGIMVLERKGVPTPFPISLGDGLLGKRLVRLSSLAARFFPGLFAFRIVMRARLLPAVALLHASAQETSAVTAKRLHAMAA